MAGVPNNPLMSAAEKKRQPVNPIWTALQNDISRASNSILSSLAAPGNAMRGDYNSVEINRNGSVNPFNGPLMDAASNMAGVVSLGSMPMPRPFGSLGMGGMGRPSNLPFSESLSLPPAPSSSQLRSMGRIESVPLEQARATNSLQWDRFNSGDHPPPMAEGFSDKPIAVRKENGEYLIYDGHHRTALEASKGRNSMDMYVIDARDFAPADAGRKPPAAPKWSSADDDLMRELGF